MATNTKKKRSRTAPASVEAGAPDVAGAVEGAASALTAAVVGAGGAVAALAHLFDAIEHIIERPGMGREDARASLDNARRAVGLS